METSLLLLFCYGQCRDTPDRRQLARYGLVIGDVRAVIASALGAQTVTTTVEGASVTTLACANHRSVHNSIFLAFHF
jgi:Cu/Ag efflux pump CusA